MNQYQKKKNFTIKLKNVNISYYFGEYFDDFEPKDLEHNDINITFVPREKQF